VHRMSPRWGWPRRIVRSRGRGQGLVEYGLIVAVVAFVTFAGLNVLSSHETAYFNGMALDPVAPSAPGALIHSSSLTFVCTPAVVPALVATPITCTATVDDTYSTASDRKPPRGTVSWTFPDKSTGECNLPSTPPIGFETTCSAPYKANPLSYIPGKYKVTAQYNPNHLSNHYPAPSPEATVTVADPTLDVSCTNTLNTTLPVGQVELGFPLDCQVKVSSGTQPIPGEVLTWSQASTEGIGILTCRTQGTGLNIWTNHTDCPAPDLTGAGSLACTTNASGVCGVIYRHLYDTGGGALGAAPVLSVELDYANNLTKSTASYPIKVVTPAAHPHATDTAAVCTRTGGNATVTPSTLTDGSAVFNTTASIKDISGSPTFKCDIRVLDKAPNPAYSGAASADSPDRAPAYPPTGLVNLTYNSTAVGYCALRPVPTTPPSAPPTQALGQEPFFAGCTAVDPSGKSTAITLNDAPGSSGTLRVSFEGAEPGHTASFSDIDVTFH
jgi:hypothetical protein